jgi:psp operon transcriptional activator
MRDPTALVGQAPAFLDALERASAAARLNRPVLVIGERGTGKELIAERVHRLSNRWDADYVMMNCAALPETLIDAELFGYEAGAFTGATKARAGRFEEADGGTLFLDEIGTLSAQAQEKLLRLIEYGQFQRVGSNEVRTVDVRVVGATNEDLPHRAAKGTFRADLLDRLSFEVITLPPLRARPGDILLLADHFASRMALELGWPGFAGFSQAAQRALAAYPWPGNVRELKNVVERAVYRSGDADGPIDALQFDPFESPYRPGPPPPPLTSVPASTSAPSLETTVLGDFRAQVGDYEKRLLSAALERARFNQREAALLLALSYDQLRHALKKHGLL